ncbi:MAG TPA: hypothetical protein VFJ58_27595 [Armatimonadota bacterium]|nr:hypothetical protein [Armatimonadota bacterium]
MINLKLRGAFVLAALTIGMLLIGHRAARAQMVTGSQMTDFAKVFGLDHNPPVNAYAAQLVSSTITGNILWPGDRLMVTIKVDNHLSTPLTSPGKLDVVAYGTKGEPGNVWVPTVYKIGLMGSVPVSVNIPPRGSTTITVSPPIPARFGGYALVMDLGPNRGRRFVVSCVRTFKPGAAPVQYPALSLDDLGPGVLSRLGVHAIRWGVSYKPTTSSDFDRWYADQGRQLKALKAAGVTVLAMFGGGDFFGPTQPLGRPRPWLDANRVMMDTKFDLAWLPSYDDDFRKLVARLCTDYGWPRGPITACSLWNEPWEGISISGWGADMIRYRAIYSKMVQGVHQAREAGADVLVGGCDSSANALDKLFPDGTNRFLPDFDFLSVHYQGMDSFATYKPWVNRKGPEGRVRIWDTESWVANTDDRVAALIAANRSAGYDRAMGVYGGVIHEGENAWSTAAAVGAAQHFLGDRKFKQLVFKNGLPWVMQFAGLNGNAEDGTVVVVGDLGEEFGADNILFRTARGLAEVAHKEKLRKELAALTPAEAKSIDTNAPKTAGQGSPVTRREALLEAISTPETLSNASLTLSDAGGKAQAFDFYGNLIRSRNGKIVIPLDGRGFFLRGNGRPGSFAALLGAIRAAKITGIEPLATMAHDMESPIAARPNLRLTFTNVLNRPVRGRLTLSLGRLKLTPASQILTFRPHETKDVMIRVTGGKAVDSNSYPLALRFDAGADGVVIHHEVMHVNLIAHRTITVDGKLNDWQGVLPETVVSEKGAPTVTEAAWFPFKTFPAAAGQGIATGYLAYDKNNFYFAVKVADSTPDGGALRFATRNDDQFFYPAVSYVKRIEHPQIAPRLDTDPVTPMPLTWPKGVRRYSYRKNPILPAGDAPDFDNVQIAFNVLPPNKKAFYPNPPGTEPDYTISDDTDYEYALNKVANRFGGGTEIWRLAAPGMPIKNFYPRQPKSPMDGPVTKGKLVVVQGPTTRIVEAAIPWSEIPAVKARMEARQPIKFSFRVNDNAGVGCMELSRGRSVAKRGDSFHVPWVEHWENQVEFGWEE